MTARTDLVRALLTVVRTLPGLRPATPSTDSLASKVPWDLDAIAVDVNDELVEIRLVALTLPLPPVLRHAETVLRSTLDDTPWEKAFLRLVITDVDASAFVSG